MEIRRASFADLKSIEKIVHQTIRMVYSRYYPSGAVDFFLSHHCEKSILTDIVAKRVLILDVDEMSVGTVTVKENEICRLFVLPEHQRNGYGKALLDFSERLIAVEYERIRLDASLPAKAIYLKRGYKDTEYHSILTENGDYLVYDVMEKSVL